MKYSIKIIFILIIIAISLYFLYDRTLPNSAPVPVKDIVGITNTIPYVADLKTYENTTYNYKLEYPTTGTTQQKIEELDKKTPHNISFDIGTTTFISIFVPEFYLDSNNTFADVVSTAENLLSLDLKSFVQEVRRYHTEFVKNNPDYSIDYKNLVQVGDIMESSFLGSKAYSFALTGSLYTGVQSMLVRSRYETYEYMFVEHDGTKYIILSSQNDPVSESILNTFKFID